MNDPHESPSASVPGQFAGETARIESEARFLGAGCLLRGVGVVLLFLFPIGTAVGVILLLLGNRFTVKYLCSHCRAELPGRQVRVCPGCWRKLQ